MKMKTHEQKCECGNLISKSIIDETDPYASPKLLEINKFYDLKGECGIVRICEECMKKIWIQRWKKEVNKMGNEELSLLYKIVNEEQDKRRKIRQEEELRKLEEDPEFLKLLEINNGPQVRYIKNGLKIIITENQVKDLMKHWKLFFKEKPSYGEANQKLEDIARRGTEDNLLARFNKVGWDLKWRLNTKQQILRKLPPIRTIKSVFQGTEQEEILQLRKELLQKIENYKPTFEEKTSEIEEIKNENRIQN